jgi:hypothetical protein
MGPCAAVPPVLRWGFSLAPRTVFNASRAMANHRRRNGAELTIEFRNSPVTGSDPCERNDSRGRTLLFSNFPLLVAAARLHPSRARPRCIVYRSKGEFIRFLEDYASGIGAPVRTRSLVCVMPKITALWTWQRLEVSFGRENVVVATGPFQAPKLVVRQAVIRLREIMSADAITMFFIRYSLVVANSAIIHSQSHHCSPRVFAHLGARPAQSKKLGKRR